MRTRIMVFATLLVLGGVFPAWANPRTEPAQPVEETEPPSLIQPAPGQKAIKLPVPSRGQLLYENHCMACHESVVHIRTRPQAQSLSALRAQVLHWVAYMQLRWDTEEIEEVVDHLNRHYYQFESR